MRPQQELWLLNFVTYHRDEISAQGMAYRATAVLVRIDIMHKKEEPSSYETLRMISISLLLSRRWVYTPRRDRETLYEDAESQGNEVLVPGTTTHLSTDTRHRTNVFDIVLNHQPWLAHACGGYPQYEYQAMNTQYPHNCRDRVTALVPANHEAAYRLDAAVNKLVDEIKKTQSIVTTLLPISTPRCGDLHIKVRLQQKHRLHKLWPCARCPKLKREFNDFTRDISVVRPGKRQSTGLVKARRARTSFVTSSSKRQHNLYPITNRAEVRY
ncbi:hypothetical protein EVAR_42920_1 [Eumeta japonica]|uniref:Uncharacterized protein n=1 Tax=Eumeta variegata TaxID=151549 RepID=A0A4C1WV26_EUMVA|nr:hypothetical protein EVAR_42920_1 [Eumeta japonica]